MHLSTEHDHCLCAMNFLNIRSRSRLVDRSTNGHFWSTLKSVSRWNVPVPGTRRLGWISCTTYIFTCGPNACGWRMAVFKLSIGQQ